MHRRTAVFARGQLFNSPATGWILLTNQTPGVTPGLTWAQRVSLLFSGSTKTGYRKNTGVESGTTNGC